MKRTLVLAVLGLALATAGTVSAAPAGPLTIGATEAAVATTTKCTAVQGQALIEAGRYEQAVREFSCVVDSQPTEVEGYRGRMEANALLGRYAAALNDYGLITAYVLPVHPDAESAILAGYADRLGTDAASVPALTGVTFARWCFFDYPQAVQAANRLLEVVPGDVTGTLIRGSSRVLKGITTQLGVADLDHAIALAPNSPDVRFVVADAYTYGLPDPERAFAEASLALDWGLDTPRVHAILAAAYNAFGEIGEAAVHVQEHIDQVTTELVATPPLAAGEELELELVPGRTYEIPVPAVAGQPIVVTTSSPDFWDSIAVLLSPDGEPVVGSDDDSGYFAAIDWDAEQTGTYLVRVTSFEAFSTGMLAVARD